MAQHQNLHGDNVGNAMVEMQKALWIVKNVTDAGGWMKEDTGDEIDEIIPISIAAALRDRSNLQ